MLNFYTAKRLLHALHVSVRRHEEVFGEIETDINKRIQVPRGRGPKVGPDQAPVREIFGENSSKSPLHGRLLPCPAIEMSLPRGSICCNGHSES